MKLQRQPVGKKTKTLYLPAITILASVLTLLVILSIHTIRNLHKDRARMEESLHRDGTIILRSLEAGARSGMMRMMDQEDLIQGLIEEIANRMDLAFAMILDRSGQILAHSRAGEVGKEADNLARYQGLFEGNKTQSWFNGDGIYVIGKKFEPIRSGRQMGKGHGSMMHSMMDVPRLGLRGRGAYGRPTIAVLGLKTTLFEEARKRDVNHAVLMGIILFFLGSAAFYFIFVVQNYYLVHRTLDSMTTYTTQVVDNMPNGLISISPEGEIVTFNSKVREIFGLQNRSKESEQLKGQFLNSCGSLLEKVERGGTVIEEEVQCTGPNGEMIPLSISGAKLKSEDDEDLGSVFILRDMREIKALQERVKRSERLAALGGLAAGVAHEIRNPLSSIRGFAQFFLKKYPPGSVDQQYSQVMIKEVDRLNRVIANMLDFARPKEPVLEKISLNDVVQHSLDLIHDDANSRGIEIHKSLKDSLPIAMMDRDQITQALLNVLINALEATDKGGKVEVETSFDEEGQIFRITVRDTGSGIPEKDLQRIFDPFYTTKKKGTGLGLAIVHRIMENHGGHIWAESKEGKGTIFILEFPGAEKPQ